jgi:hypothetical protein
MVYTADPSLWDDHIDCAKRVGLEMSVGKAYHHAIYANINSTSVHYDLSVEKEVGRSYPNTPWQINYLNAGLYYGQHKVQSRDLKTTTVEYRGCSEEITTSLYAEAHLGQDPEKGLVVNMNTLMQGCLPGRASRILDSFLRYHGQDILCECTAVLKKGTRRSLITRNLFLPISSGGMGVNAPPRWKFKVSNPQRLLCANLMAICPQKKTTTLPIMGIPVIEDDPSLLAAPWARKTGSIEKPVYRIFRNKRPEYSLDDEETYVVRKCRQWDVIQGFVTWRDPIRIPSSA